MTPDELRDLRAHQTGRKQRQLDRLIDLAAARPLELDHTNLTKQEIEETAALAADVTAALRRALDDGTDPRLVVDHRPGAASWNVRTVAGLPLTPETVAKACNADRATIERQKPFTAAGQPKQHLRTIVMVHP